jgi:hypothetical protein
MAQATLQVAGTIETSLSSAQSPIERVRAAQALHRRNRAQGLAALNEIFRTGQPPATPLNGQYVGELVALNIAPGVTQFVEWLLAQWLPWKGKTFDATSNTGDNVFTRDSYSLAHVLWPFYRKYIEVGPQTYRAFTFRTYVAAGFQDPDRQVLKINYDSPENPRLSIRRVLDELVQIDDGYYLGKAHLQWLWGSWQMVAFFGLRTKS